MESRNLNGRTVRVINSIWSIAALLYVSLGSLEWKNWSARLLRYQRSWLLTRMQCTTRFSWGAFFTLKIHYHDSWSMVSRKTFSLSLTDSRLTRNLDQWTCKNCIISWQKTRLRNVSKTPTNTTNFTYYLLILLYDTLKNWDFDVWSSKHHVRFATINLITLHNYLEQLLF